MGLVSRTEEMHKTINFVWKQRNNMAKSVYNFARMKTTIVSLSAAYRRYHGLWGDELRLKAPQIPNMLFYAPPENVTFSQNPYFIPIARF